jgi:hypothetical protein
MASRLGQYTSMSNAHQAEEQPTFSLVNFGKHRVGQKNRATLGSMNSPSDAAELKAHAERPFAARRDDTIAGLCGVWMISGLFLDGWAHRHQKPETFFSPWHGILYSGFIASALWMLYVVRRHQQPGVSLRTTLPVGYGFRAAGVGIFGVGAVADLIWHTVFGIEVSIEALLSPSHLVLLAGGLLMAIGPIVSTLAREPQQRPTWASTGPIVGTVAFITSLMQFFIMYLSPFDSWLYTRAQDTYALIQGGNWVQQTVTIRNVAHMLLFTVFMVLPTLWLLRNVKLPRGAFLAVWFLPTVLQSLLDSFHSWQRLAGSLVAALLAEALWPTLDVRFKGNARIAMLATLLGAMSFVTWIGLFLTMWAHHTLGWQAELWFGVPTFSALLSALIVLSTSTTRQPV